MSTNHISEYIEELRKILKKCTSNTLWGHHNEFEILILYKTDVKHIVELFEKQNLEISKKDKIINLMAEHICNSAIVDDTVCALKCDCETDINEDCTQEKMMKCTKQYFERKVEDERDKI